MRCLQSGNTCCHQAPRRWLALICNGGLRKTWLKLQLEKTSGRIQHREAFIIVYLKCSEHQLRPATWFSRVGILGKLLNVCQCLNAFDACTATSGATLVGWPSTIYDYLKVCAKSAKWIRGGTPPQKQQGAPIKEKESKPTVLAKLVNIGNSDQIFHFCGSQDLPLAEVIYKSRKHFQELSCESPSLSLQQALKNTHGKRIIEWLIKSKHSNQV